MKSLQHALVVFLLSSSSLARAAVPTKESVERLFVAAHVEQMVTAKQSQVAATAKHLIEDVFPGPSRKPEVRTFLEAHATGFSAKLKTEFNWEKLRGEFTRIYQETFTQAEIDAQIAFYESAAGRAVAEKAPIISITTSQLMQERVTPLIQQSTKEAIDEVKRLMQRKKK